MSFHPLKVIGGGEYRMSFEIPTLVGERKTSLFWHSALIAPACHFLRLTCIKAAKPF